MSIEIWGDVTEAQHEYYKRNHTHVIINGRIITKEEELAKEKAEQERIRLEKRAAFRMKAAGWFICIIAFVALYFSAG
ncbi:hypothetical protein [Serratia sp. Se-RSBMAAmG]|uniref:hypothetical protein n=1 Tax=Serratia sp. Se-RSBMAAmG TaxID=3043305 RepID=UPI0024AF2D48|nr:hypothetical protein [Serratia sp. Se-RSBMAAmG]MDI6976049.1 hypothetical protein [Serratia sp. Se-RSBMAAmG]